jgi:hypothetical protein
MRVPADELADAHLLVTDAAIDGGADFGIAEVDAGGVVLRLGRLALGLGLAHLGLQRAHPQLCGIQRGAACGDRGAGLGLLVAQGGQAFTGFGAGGGQGV